MKTMYRVEWTSNGERLSQTYRTISNANAIASALLDHEVTIERIQVRD